MYSKLCKDDVTLHSKKQPIVDMSKYPWTFSFYSTKLQVVSILVLESHLFLPMILENTLTKVYGIMFTGFNKYYLPVSLTHESLSFDNLFIASSMDCYDAIMPNHISVYH